MAENPGVPQNTRRSRGFQNFSRLRAADVVRDRASGQPLGVDPGNPQVRGQNRNFDEFEQVPKEKQRIAQGDTLAWLFVTLQFIVPILAILTGVIAGGMWLLSLFFFS